NLAPTNSTLATLAMGDAMAVTLMRARDFAPKDFAKFHPGGSLGRRLISRVKDAMSAPPPMTTPETSIGDALLVMTEGRKGLVLVMDENKDMLGIVTDGDLRRGMQKFPGLLDRPVKTIMNKNPITIDEDA